jgi:hypothetical protein
MAWWWLGAWWSSGGACGWPNSSCERLWAIHRNGVSKNQPVESTWSSYGSRGSYTLARVLQRYLRKTSPCSSPFTFKQFTSITRDPKIPMIWYKTIWKSYNMLYNSFSDLKTWFQSLPSQIPKVPEICPLQTESSHLWTSTLNSHNS